MRVQPQGVIHADNLTAVYSAAEAIGGCCYVWCGKVARLWVVEASPLSVASRRKASAPGRSRTGTPSSGTWRACRSCCPRRPPTGSWRSTRASSARPPRSGPWWQALRGTLFFALFSEDLCQCHPTNRELAQYARKLGAPAQARTLVAGPQEGLSHAPLSSLS